MRKVKLAAIQPGHVDVPSRYDFASGEYVNDPGEIIESVIAPQLAVSVALLEKAGEAGCDIVTTSEDAASTSDYFMDITERNIFPELVDRAMPMTEAAFAEVAWRYGMYVVGCYYIRQGDDIFNTASIFDRKGEIVGQYRKTHFPANERWQCTPGDNLMVFELDFGKVGILICYDIFFQEPAQVLALRGAEVIFHPTFGYGWYDSIGEATLRTRANDNGLYIVTAKNYVYNGAGKSSVIDYWGQVMCDAGFNKDVIVTAEVDLDQPKRQPDWYYNTPITGIAEVTERVRRERRPELYGAICAPNKRLKVPDQTAQLKILEGIKSGKYHW